MYNFLFFFTLSFLLYKMKGSVFVSSEDKFLASVLSIVMLVAGAISFVSTVIGIQ